MFGDANHATDFFKREFMMGAEHSVAIQAVHGATHTAHIGVKYTWFGSGYISNMFYKMIANKPTYRFQRGGDLRYVLFGDTDTSHKCFCIISRQRLDSTSMRMFVTEFFNV